MLEWLTHLQRLCSELPSSSKHHESDRTEDASIGLQPQQLQRAMISEMQALILGHAARAVLRRRIAVGQQRCETAI